MVGGVAIVAAGTGVAAGYEHEGAGIFYRIFGAADGDVAIFERLTEHFEGGFVELREFVAKEYAIVGQARFLLVADCCRRLPKLLVRWCGGDCGKAVGR